MKRCDAFLNLSGTDATFGCDLPSGHDGPHYEYSEQDQWAGRGNPPKFVEAIGVAWSLEPKADIEPR